MKHKSECYRAAIFDLDGVIADTARFHFLAWKQLASDLGISLTDEDEHRLKGLERLASLEVVLGERSSQYSTQEKEVLATRKNDCYCRLIQTLTPSDLLAGAGELLDLMAAQNIPIALASASKNAHAVIERLGVAECFTYIADANEVQNPKPHPEIFLRAASGLGLGPAACVGIEDAVAGVEAINSAGMHSVGVGDSAVLSKARDVISSLLEFPFEKFFAVSTPIFGH